MANPDTTPETQSAHQARVWAAFAGEPPDRVPTCELAFASSVAGRVLGREVYTGSTDVMFAEACAWLDGESAHEEFLDRLFADTLDLHRHFDWDIFHPPWRRPQRPTRRLDEYRILYGDPDGEDWSIQRYDPGTRTFDECQRGGPAPTAESVMAHLRREIAARDRGRRAVPVLDPFLVRAVRECGHEFVVAGGAGMAVPMETAWLEVVALDPGLMADYLDVVLDDLLHQLRLQKEAGLRLMSGGGDLAFRSGPIYSPAFFRSVMLPRFTRVFDTCRELGLAYVMRSDGDLWPVAEDLFGRARPHAYGEVDYDAGMHFDELRERFPELVLMGNVSCDLLRRGSPDVVRRRARACVDAAWPRVIVCSANAVLHGTPIDNVYALYETA